jgi:ribonuclease P protein component
VAARSSSGGEPRGASGSPSRPFALPRAERLRSAGEFQAVFERGRRLERPAFVVLWSLTPEKRKTGFTVSRQIRGAVKRNRARRRLREAYRSRTTANPGDISMVFVARPPALDGAFAGLVQAVDEVMRQLGRIVGRTEGA